MALAVLLRLAFTILALAIIFISARIIQILPPRKPPLPRKRGSPTTLMIVLGSGGHTAEMLAMLKDLDPTLYTRRIWVVGEDDWLSKKRAAEFEQQLEGKVRAGGAGKSGSAVKTDIMRTRQELRPTTGANSYTIVGVPRARRIHQPLYTTPFSALLCLWACIRLLMAPSGVTHMKQPLSLQSKPKSSKPSTYPDLIITNGPATATILILATCVLRFFNVQQSDTQGKMRTIYVESWARVKRLSLSGKLLVRVVDRFVVQWPSLEGMGGRGEYLGILV